MSQAECDALARELNHYVHRTNRAAADEILRDGFRDGTGGYRTDQDHTGVWLSDRDIDVDPGAHTAVLLSVEIPAALVEPFEWIEGGKPYREFLVPAAVLNQNGRVTELLE